MAINDSFTYHASQTGGMNFLQRASDNAFIPLDLENMAYQEFLTWITEGNTAPQGWTGPTNASPSTG